MYRYYVRCFNTKYLMIKAEPPPTKTIIRQEMPKEMVEKIRVTDEPPLDRDIGNIN